jgi:hypothetical protein
MSRTRFEVKAKDIGQVFGLALGPLNAPAVAKNGATGTAAAFTRGPDQHYAANQGPV